MWLLLLGLVLFIGVHLISALPRNRNRLIKKFGEKTFKLGFSATALIGLIMMIIGYELARESAAIIYEPPFELRSIALLLMVIAFVLFVAGYLKSYIRWYVRHPQITSIKIWAFAHLLVNGDAASILLFGSFLVWAIFDRISLKKREGFGLVKSRNFEPNILHDLIAIAIAGAIYWAFAAYLHGWLIGVPLL